MWRLLAPVLPHLDSALPPNPPGSRAPSSPWPSAAGKQPRLPRPCLQLRECVSAGSRLQRGRGGGPGGVCGPDLSPQLPGPWTAALVGVHLGGAPTCPPRAQASPTQPRGAGPSTRNLSGLDPSSGPQAPRQGCCPARSAPPGRGHSPHLPSSPRSPGTWPELVGHRPDGGLQDRVAV